MTKVVVFKYITKLNALFQVFLRFVEHLSQMDP